MLHSPECVNNPHAFESDVTSEITMCVSGDCNSKDGPSVDGEQNALNRILTGLQHPYRRYLLYYLQEEKACELREAARRIAAWDHECDVAAVPSDIHDSIELELYHTHLPKLEALDIIDYDQRSGSVRLQDPPDQLPKFLELARTEDGVD